MIDSIYSKANIDTQKKPYNYIYNAIRDGLTEIIDEGISSHLNQPFLTGKLENFHVFIKGNVLKFNGSLCKYLLGENVSTLSKDQIDAALKKLTQQMGFPVRQATLSRIDISTNLTVKYLPEIYLECLESMQNASILPWKGTKTFKRSRESLTFYDKKAELKKKDPAVYRRFEDTGNLLRYELTLSSKLHNLVGQDDLRVLWLHSSLFLQKLAVLWYNYYEAVIKKPISYIPDMASAKMHKAYTEFDGLQNKGSLQQVFKEIDIYKKANKWTANSASRLKRGYKTLYLDDRFTQPSPLVEELDSLIYGSNDMAQFIFV
ncbi:phage/plasmid replication domain-containing protein [Mucilaginibacter lacusdianchii]|uniref:phage/plasmid replication domain-containing protein n=1 Tax=Mucilaginibacter lacusdianchii TaxID=2684211 RepID=UPI00131C82EC|nr:phage/plasmid replication protein [Mucilaginibacter sp. JXJ CY 39]